MNYLDSENDNPNILDMDGETRSYINFLLDDRGIREEFVKVLPKHIFSYDDYQVMEREGNHGVNMTPGKWLLRFLGNLGGRVSDLIYWFEEINLERALILLKEEEPLHIIEQPKPSITVNEGEKFCITCRASGYPYPEYQWFKDDEELLLQQEQVLTVASAKIEDGGTYVCKVSKRNADSNIQWLLSDPVAVLILPCKPSNLCDFSRQCSEEKPPISTDANMKFIQSKLKGCDELNILSTKCHESEKIDIVKQPRSYGKVAQGVNLLFKCYAKASHPVKYQWYRNNRKLDGEISHELVVDQLYPDPETGNMKFRYFCEVYNEYDQIFSEFATVELSESDENTKYVAEEKIALLIANDKYEAYEDLVTPPVDVVDLAKLFKSINFKVIVLRNLSLIEMKKACEAFCTDLKPGSYAVVFFAGHGFGCYRKTYLQPIDCSENFVPEESLCTGYILKQIQETKPALIVLLIDACRKPPPELPENAPIEYDASMGNNTVYGYATTFLNSAYESQERNSYFVKHLKKYISSDKGIEEILFQVKRDFHTETLTKNLQYPVIETSLSSARKLCDELRNPLTMITCQLPCWFYQERSPIRRQTQTIGEHKCYFMIEIKDHMDVFFNVVDVILYACIKKDADLDKLYKSGLQVDLDVPSLNVHKGFRFENASLKLDAKNPIIEEVIDLQKIQNPEVNGQIIIRYKKTMNFPFSVTIEKIKSMDKFFR